ncbi:MAG: hypothetical protein BROFUL_00740 [Candidatus Brocadia fulgida]|uniref:Uncharacterized protein n=1 Tax=Candidatus Brocadia fulgida TaxID=380242 RepID=A0A0M2UXC9_9BACT|nr:MAG: hypothetical protein BROFUL_00740 [Candidatus Brocadia fulgida]
MIGIEICSGEHLCPDFEIPLFHIKFQHQLNGAEADRASFKTLGNSVTVAQMTLDHLV